VNNLTLAKASRLQGELFVPGDKSISHRAIMFGSLAQGATTINNFLMSADCLATLECFRQMGIHGEMSNVQGPMSNDCKLIIYGKGLCGLKCPTKTLDVGNSGTTIRLMTGILAGQEFETKISGDSSIQKRPMGRVVRPLSDMGANIVGNRGPVTGNSEVYPPLTIYGRQLKGITYELPVASAQVKSAVLLAGLYAQGETRVIETIPSRDHTERMMQYFSIPDYQLPITSDFTGKEVAVPGDISSAAFFIVAALLAQKAELRLHNVGLNPTRTGILDVIRQMGGGFTVENERIICNEPRGEIIVKTQKEGLRGVKLAGEIIPNIIDEIPIIAVLATQAAGVTEIRGARELRVKESDRLATVTAELRKFGAKIEELEDGLIIHGPTRLHGAKIDSHGDHRIAMAMAIAGLVADGETIIENTACIETSFPGFEKLLHSLTI